MATLAAAEVQDAPYGSSLEHVRDELARIDALVRGQVAHARAAGSDGPWHGLAISEAEIDAVLARSLGAAPWGAPTMPAALADAHALADRLAAAIDERCACTAVPLRLVGLARRFALTRFDVDALLIALAPEIDLGYERLYAYLHGDVNHMRPSLDLALHLLCRSLDERFAARARFGAGAPLVRHGLLHVVVEAPAAPRLAHVLKVDDRIVDWLHGSSELEPRLAQVARRMRSELSIDELELDGAVRARLANLAAEIVEAGEAADASDPPVLYLRGPAGVGKRTAGAAFAGALGCGMLALDCAALDATGDDAVAMIFAAAREARLTGDGLLFEAADCVLTGERRAARAALLAALAEAPGPCVLTGAAAWEPGDALPGRRFLQLELGLPDSGAQLRLWGAALAGAPLAGDVDLAALAARLRLTGAQIHDAAATARSIAHLRAGAGTPVAAADLVEACQRHTGHRFGGLARKVLARPGWDDLVLPPDRVLRLRELCDHARHRATVF